MESGIKKIEFSANGWGDSIHAWFDNNKHIQPQHVGEHDAAKVNLSLIQDDADELIEALVEDGVDYQWILYECQATGLSVVRMSNGDVAITDDYLTDYVRIDEPGKWVRESDQLQLSEGIKDFLSKLEPARERPDRAPRG